MGIDEKIFRWFYKKYYSIKKSKSELNSFYTFRLEEHIKRIEIFLNLLSGLPIHISEGKDSFSIKGNCILLPNDQKILRTKEDSLQFLNFILVLIGIRFSNPENSNRMLSKIVKESVLQYPNLRFEWKGILKNLRLLKKENKSHYDFLKSFLIKINFNFYSEESIQSHKDSIGNEANTKYNKQTQSSLKANLEESELLEIDKNKIDEYTLNHSFEKIDTVEEFNGQWRDIDSSDEMEEQEEAVSELNMKYLVRSDDITHSTMSTDSGSGVQTEMFDSKNSEIEILYDEWNYKEKEYRKNYCKVIEADFIKTDLQYIMNILFKSNKTLIQIKNRIRALLNEKSIKKRLANGTDIDLDAITERYSDLFAKVTPSDLVYTRNSYDKTDLGIYFLLDISLSTDSWIDGVRILDIEKEALILLGSALDSIGLNFGISGFYSRTRNQCKFLRIKDFDSKWEKSKNKIGAIEPSGYTRIGPAIRHAGSLFTKIKNKQKWIVLLTDAKPNDYDRYEGKYGEEDVNSAIKEIKQAGIHLYTIAIGSENSPTIPRMMKEASYTILSHPKRLLETMESFIKKLIDR